VISLERLVLDSRAKKFLSNDQVVGTALPPAGPRALEPLQRIGPVGRDLAGDGGEGARDRAGRIGGRVKKRGQVSMSWCDDRRTSTSGVVSMRLHAFCSVGEQRAQRLGNLARVGNLVIA
jgi:hypothetical protein